MLKRDREQMISVDKYPWLDPENERREHDGQGDIGEIYQFKNFMSE